MYLQWFQGSSQPLGNAFHCEPKMTRVFSHAFSFSTAIGIWYSFYECIYHIGSLASTKTRGFFAPKAGCESGNALLAHLRVASQMRDFSRPGVENGENASEIWDCWGFSNWKQYKTITFPRFWIG